MPLINVNNQSIYYEIHGKQKDIPLVLISGLGCDHTMWDSILESLSKNHQVILLDNRGIGQSSTPIEEYTINDMAHDIRKLLDALDIYKVNIIGSSMGGIIAQEYAVNFPEHVNKMVLCSTLTRLKARTQRLLMTTARFFELGHYDDAFNSMLTNAYGDNFLANKNLVQQTFDRIKNNPFPQSIEAFYGQYHALRNSDTISRLHKIHASTLIIAGERDILSLHDDAEELSAIPNSTVVTIPEVAHLAHIENPVVFLQIVQEFLS